MARGFESKDVEYQQAEAQRPKQNLRTHTPAEREARERRRTIELSLSRAQGDLASATSAAHRRMLGQAIEALRERLQRL